MRKILVVIGTRPEAIKMAPLVHRLRAIPSLQTIVCLAAQAHLPLDQELAIFGIRVDEDLSRAQRGRGLGDLHANVMQWIDQMIGQYKPDCVLVPGEATTVLASFQRCISADYAGVGLRMYELRHRGAGGAAGREIELIATRYFVSSAVSYRNLLNDGVAAGNIFLGDSPAVDALTMALERIRNDTALQDKLGAAFPFLDPDKRLILFAGHRRGHHGSGLENVCHALMRLAMRPDVQVVYPVPPNPRVRSIVDEIFADHPNAVLIEPQDYPHFIYLMQTAYLVITGSGDIQAEARALGKPVLLTREAAECPEAGHPNLVGTDAGRIQLECARLLDDPACYRAFSSQYKPSSDGQASQRIVEAMLQ